MSDSVPYAACVTEDTPAKSGILTEALGFVKQHKLVKDVYRRVIVRVACPVGLDYSQTLSRGAGDDAAIVGDGTSTQRGLPL